MVAFRDTCNSAFLGRFFCTGQQQLWRPSWNFKIIFSIPLLIIVFKPKIVSNLCKNFLCIVWHQKPTVWMLPKWRPICQNTNKLDFYILYFTGIEGPKATNPAKYIRYIFNRVILENAPIRAAAVSTLAKFGAISEELLPNILVLLHRFFQ